MLKNLLAISLFLVLVCCKEKSGSKNIPEKLSKTIAEPVKEFEYTEFKPDSISGINIKGFKIDYSYKIKDKKLIVGYYEPVDGKITLPDTEKDWGDRLLLLNDRNEILYKSPGAGDVYKYEPHFYKNPQNNKILVVCQLAYEYPFGGDAFLIENGTIKSLGNLDIESNSMEKELINILKIHESNNKIIFTFDSDSLILKPGSEDILIRNNNVRYVYDRGSLKFIR